jgi:DNA polymerase-3 subunit alpha (Gram-positive type)
MSEIIRMVPKANGGEEHSPLGLRNILSHLNGVSGEERSLLETADLKEIRFEPNESVITIIVDLPARLEDDSLQKIELAAVKAIPGMRIRVERFASAAAAHDAGSLVAEAWSGIIASVKAENPLTQAWLLVSRPELKEGALTVYCADELAAKRLRDLRAEPIFAAALKRHCGIAPKILFAAGELELPPPAPAPLEVAAAAKENRVFLGSARGVAGDPVPIPSVNAPARHVLLEGDVFLVDLREGRRSILTFGITDQVDSLRVKLFEPPDSLKALREGMRCRITGKVAADSFERDELVLTPRDVVRVDSIAREDNAPEKRVELNCHTKFSRLNGLIDLERLIERVKAWGWPGVVVTDDAVVQAFPKLHSLAAKAGLKAGFGCQLHYVDDLKPIAWNFDPKSPRAERLLSRPSIVFDFETTGLGARSHKVIEVAAYRVENQKIVDEYRSMVNPHEPISDIVKRITHITDEMVADAPEWPAVLEEFRKFAKGAILVAHNIRFDAGFLRADWPKRTPLPPLVDTIGIARVLLKEIRNYTLGTVAKALKVPLVDAHRAADDARALARIYIEFVSRLKDRGVETLDALEALRAEIEPRKIPSQEVVALVEKQEGLRNLYEIVTAAHLEHLHMRPRAPATLVEKYRGGLLLGSGALNGPVAEAMIMGEDSALVEALAKRFDYLEVAPPELHAEKLAEGTFRSEDDIRAFIREMLDLAKRVKRPVVAVGAAHHLDPHEVKFRKIARPMKSENLASQHLRTTTEMLDGFAFLGDETARRLVLDAPAKLLAGLDSVSPLPKGFFPPIIDGADEELRDLTMKNALAIYADAGGKLPVDVAERVERELNAIINNKFAVLYLIAVRLVASSLANGFVVGSRGSVGSSLVAFLTGITEVNPLAPHYRCSKCRKITFVEGSGSPRNVDRPRGADSARGACGPDLAEKGCCGEPMMRDGYRIPFEAFMGLKGDKTPDIDLNFAGEYQGRAMAEIVETFGSEHVFRAGTISTLKMKNAAGFVRKHMEEHSLSWRGAEVDRCALGITDVARTTGQHPGGIVIIPRDRKITEFMPVHRPADSESSDDITTHFDFHSYEGIVVKCDVLGHDSPTAVRMLKDFTGVDPMTVPLNDSAVLSLFSSPAALGLSEQRLKQPVGTLALPEFGTPLVIQILTETKPTTVEELIRISGVSHGTDVWKGNAQDLIRNGTARLSEVIATREDIWNELVKHGLEPAKAFGIMEKVRKGKGLAPEDEALMKKHKVKSWIIDSCRKIKYMFPKAHAVAYVLMALRIAWFKVHRPAAFYATWLSLKVDDFNLETAVAGEKMISQTLSEIRAKERDRTATAKEESQAVVLEVLREMFLRGIALEPVSLEHSDIRRFTCAEKAVRAPLRAVQGLGEKVARRLAEEFATGTIESIDDLVERTGLSRPLVERLKKAGAFGALPDSNQLALF